jgi:hypothetical protein
MATTKKPAVPEEDTKMTTTAPKAAPAPVQEPTIEVPIDPIFITPAEPSPVQTYHQLTDEEARRVSAIKEKFTDTVSYLKVLRDSFHDAEVQRCLSVAITEAETASMWAVRAVTWRG